MGVLSVLALLATVLLLVGGQAPPPPPPNPQTPPPSPGTQPPNTVKLTLINNCGQDIYPAFQGESKDGKSDPLAEGGGIKLESGKSKEIFVPCKSAATRIWTRTKCTGTDGSLKCETGDCGPKIQCQGTGAIQTPTDSNPVSIAEFTFGTPGGDSYDTSYVDGYNVMITITPDGGTGDKCKEVGQCSKDLKSVPEFEKFKLTGTDGQPPDGGTTKALKGMCGQGGAGCCTPSKADPKDPIAPCGYEDIKSAPPGFSPENQTLLKKSNEYCPTAYFYDHDDRLKSPYCKGQVCDGMSSNYKIQFCGKK